VPAAVPSRSSPRAARLAAGLAAAWLGCATSPPAPLPAEGAAPSGALSPSRPARRPEVERLLSRLTLEEKVAQLVVAFAPPGDGPVR